MLDIDRTELSGGFNREIAVAEARARMVKYASEGILLPVFDDEPLSEGTFTVTTRHIHFTPLIHCLGIFVLGERGIKYGAHVMQDDHSSELHDYEADAVVLVASMKLCFPDTPKLIKYGSLFLGTTLQHEAIISAFTAAFPEVETKMIRQRTM